MALETKINYAGFKNPIRTIESHTVGEYCRIALDCPETKGNTMIERKHYLEENYDFLRTALMYEPRGHHDMFGAFLAEPCNKEADFGVFFIDGGGYLNMCGHCTIGAVTCILEGGLKEMKEPQTEVVLEAPAGLIRTVADVKNGKVTGVTLQNVPAFVYKRDLKLDYNGKEVVYDICFGGSFFALVDTEKNFGVRVGTDTAGLLTDFAKFALVKINEEVEIQHPELDITSVDLIECYSTTDTPDCDLRNLVIFGDAHDPQLDRSPCGTGTSAKMSLLHANGELPLNKEFVYESFIGTKFYGNVIKETKVGDFDAVIPTVRGAAYLCGEATWFLDPEDPLTEGFVVPK